MVVVSGAGKADLGSWSESVCTKWIHVPFLARSVLEGIVLERVLQAGRVISPGAVAKVEDILLTSGMGLSVLDEVLCDALTKSLCRRIVTEGDVEPPVKRARRRRGGKQVDLQMLEVLRKAGGKVTMGQFTEGLRQAFVEDGECAPTGGSIRRWAVRLERSGLVERRVVMGGMGGTRSVVALVSGHPSLR